jgi:hypothetical protein
VQKFYPAWDHGHLRLAEFDVIYPDVSFLVTGALVAASAAEAAIHAPPRAAIGPGCGAVGMAVAGMSREGKGRDAPDR